MRKFLTLSLCMFCVLLYSQDSKNIVRGKVESESSKTSLQNVHVLNLSKVVGTITDKEGKFEINASVSDAACLIITHYQRILDYVNPDYVHVIIDGKIASSGGPELARKLEESGYEWLEEGVNE